MDPSFLLPPRFLPFSRVLPFYSFLFLSSLFLSPRIYATTRLHRTWDLTGNKFRSVSLKPTRERESSRTHRWMDNWIAPVSFQVTGERNHGRGQGIGVIVAAYTRKGIIGERRIGGRGEETWEKRLNAPCSISLNLITIFPSFFFSCVIVFFYFTFLLFIYIFNFYLYFIYLFYIFTLYILYIIYFIFTLYITLYI